MKPEAAPRPQVDKDPGLRGPFRVEIQRQCMNAADQVGGDKRPCTARCAQPGTAP